MRSKLAALTEEVATWRARGDEHARTAAAWRVRRERPGQRGSSATQLARFVSDIMTQLSRVVNDFRLNYH